MNSAPSVATPPPSDPSALRQPRRGSGVLLALFASLWLLAFAPSPQTWAAGPGVVGMLALIESRRRTKHAIGYVFLFGSIAIGFGYRWLADTVRTFGELDARLGVAAVPVSYLLLVVYAMWSTIHIVLFAALYRATLRSGTRPHPLAVAALFTACEAIPVRFLAWSVGYGAAECAPLRQVAEWGGVSLVSFALLCFAVPLYEGVRWLLDHGGLRTDVAVPGPRAPRPRPRAALATVAVGLALYAAGWWRLDRVAHEDAAATEHVRVGLVQANIGSTAKRDNERERARAKDVRDAYQKGTEEAARAGAEVIVWPETAMYQAVAIWDARQGRTYPKARIDGQLVNASPGYGFLVEVGKEHALVLGGYEDEARPGSSGGASGGASGGGSGVAGARGDQVRFNVAVLREAGGESVSLYRKVKRMPFGEYIPGQDSFPSLRDLLPQAVPMSAGEPDQPPIRWKRPGKRDLTVASFICYEAIVPTLVATLAGDGRPDLLVNLTNDSWYSGWEPYQHLQFSIFRPIEHRTPMLRSTNTGITAIVSATGEVTASLGVGAVGALVADVPLVDRPRTLYASTASTQPYVWWIAALAIVLISRRRR